MAEAVTWTKLIPSLVATACKAPQKEARDFAMSQLMLLGEIVDRHIANMEALAATLPNPVARAPSEVVGPSSPWPRREEGEQG